jgi:hypothetical protein
VLAADRSTIEPKPAELLEHVRALYVGLSEFRIGPMIDPSEVELTEDAQRAATKIVDDLLKMISARKSKVEDGT